MDTEDSEIREQKHLGGRMLVAMWAGIFVLLALIFSSILDNQHNPNQNIHTVTGIDGSSELVLMRNRYGHYVADGKINKQDVVFMLDTGATDVAIPEAIAEDLGLEKAAR